MVQLPLASIPTIDPFADLDPVARSIIASKQPKKKRRRLPAMSPEEERDILREIGHASLGGLAAAGNTLDYLGGSVRNALAGENPLAHGITSAENRTSGRDLLEQWGVLGKNKPGFDFGDVAGFALEVGLDPLTYATFGASALSKAGKLAKLADLLGDATKIGKLKYGAIGPRTSRMSVKLGDLVSDGVKSSVPARRALETAAKGAGMELTDDIMQMPLGGALGVGLPFGDAAFTVGKEGGALAGVAKGMDFIGGKLRNSAIMRHAYGMFDHKTKGAVTEYGQRHAADITRAEEAGVVKAKDELAELMGNTKLQDHFDLAAIRRELPEDLKGDDLLRATHEVVNERSRYAMEYLENPSQGYRGPEELKPALDTMRKHMDDVLTMEQEAGLDTKALGDLFAEYFPRQRRFFPNDKAFGKTNAAYDVSHQFQKQRKSFLTQIRGGTQVLQDMSVDPNISGWGWRNAASTGKPGREPLSTFADELMNKGPQNLKSPKLSDQEVDELVDYVRKNYGDRLSLDLGPGGELGVGDSEIRELTRFMAGLDPRHSNLNVPLYQTNPLKAVMARVEHGHRAAAAMKGVQKMLGESVVPIEMLDPGKGRSVLEVIEGMTKNRGVQDVTEVTKKNILDSIQSTEHGREALARAQAEWGDIAATQAKEAGIKADIAHDEVLEKFTPTVENATQQISRVFSDAQRKQAILTEFDAADRMLDTVVQAMDELGGKASPEAVSRRSFEQAKELFGVPDAPPLPSRIEKMRPDDMTLSRSPFVKEVVNQIRKGEDVSLDDIAAEINWIKGGSKLHDRVMRQAEKLADDAGLINGVDFEDVAYVWHESLLPSTKIRELLYEQAGRPLKAADDLSFSAADMAKASDALTTMLRAVEEVKPNSVVGSAFGEFKSRLQEMIKADAPLDEITQYIEARKTLRKAVGKEVRKATIGKMQKRIPSQLEKIYSRLANKSLDAQGRISRSLKTAAPEVDLSDLEKTRLAIMEQLNNADNLESVDFDALAGLANESVSSVGGRVAQSVRKAADEVAPAAADDVDEILKRVFVREDIADDTLRVIKGYTQPDSMSGLSRVMQRAMQIWKPSVTAAWPAFHSRNFVSGQVNSFLGGAWDPQSFGSAINLMKKKGVKGFAHLPEFKGMTEQQIADTLRKEAWADGVVSARHGEHIAPGIAPQATRLPGDQGPLFGSVTNMMKLKTRTPIPVGTTRLQRANPLSPETFAPYRIGSDLAEEVENMNRLVPYLNLRKKGWSRKAAADRVAALQVDYTKSAQIDPMMRNWFPFWRFTKGMVPYTIKELMERPGGRLGTAIKAQSKASSRDELLPEHIRQSTSIPLPGSPEGGGERYLTGLGLAHEVPFSFVGSGLQDSLLEAASQMRPDVKMLAEGATGQTFFQRGPLGGRPLEDLDPTYGRFVQNIQDIATGQQTEKVSPLLNSQWLELALGNTLSRAGTTARTLTDKRKWEHPISGLGLNLLTGVRISDVSPQAFDAVAREAAQAYIKKNLGGRTFSRLYIPESEKARMNANELMRAAQYERFMRSVDNRMKERRK